MQLLPHESDLVGKWLVVDGRVVVDGACGRIQFLIRNVLEKIATADGGWSTLYRDPVDSRLWELTYPHSEMQGGGPPRLSVISPEMAKQTYGELTGA